MKGLPQEGPRRQQSSEQEMQQQQQQPVERREVGAQGCHRRETSEGGQQRSLRGREASEEKPEGQESRRGSRRMYQPLGRTLGKGGWSEVVVDDLLGVAEQPRLGRDEVCKDPVVRCQDLPLHALGM